MKFLKLLLGLIIVCVLAVAVWLYYPQYQIYKAKQSRVATVSISKEDKEQKKIDTYLTDLEKIDKEKIVHLGLGDSVMKGYGAQEGESYVDVLSTELSTKLNKQVESINQGINGHTSTQLREEVLAHKYDTDITNADIISLNIGGNDILNSVKRSGYSQAFKEFSTLRDTYKDNMKEILAYVHEKNPNATVIVFELYNPVKTTESYYSLANKLLPKWNVILYDITSNKELIAETTKTINDKHLNYISDDGVHPNKDGYQQMADEVMYQLENTPK